MDTGLLPNVRNRTAPLSPFAFGEPFRSRSEVRLCDREQSSSSRLWVVTGGIYCSGLSRHTLKLSRTLLLLLTGPAINVATSLLYYLG
jgi:hypothetical protein